MLKKRKWSKVSYTLITDKHIHSGECNVIFDKQTSIFLQCAEYIAKHDKEFLYSTTNNFSFSFVEYK